MIVDYKIIKMRAIEIWPKEEVKNYLRVGHNYDDNLIKNLIDSAVEMAEKFLSISLNERHIICNIKSALDKISIKHVPCKNLNKVYLLDKEGNKTDISNNYGRFNHNLNTIFLNNKYFGKDLEIEYIAGYENDIPRPIKHGILLHIASMYDQSEYEYELNDKIKNLYTPYRQMRI